jgi:hypothetical protein
VAREYRVHYQSESDAHAELKALVPEFSKKTGLTSFVAWPSTGWALVRHPHSGVLLYRWFNFQFAGKIDESQCAVGSATAQQSRVGESWGRSEVNYPRDYLRDDEFPDIERANKAVPFNPFVATYQEPYHVQTRTGFRLAAMECATLKTFPPLR